MPITWRNVSGPSDAAAVELLKNAGTQFNRGTSVLEQLGQDQARLQEEKFDTKVDYNTQQFKNALAQYQSPEALQQAIDSGAIGQLRGQYGGMIDQEATRGLEQRLLTEQRQRATAGQQWQDQQTRLSNREARDAFDIAIAERRFDDADAILKNNNFLEEGKMAASLTSARDTWREKSRELSIRDQQTNYANRVRDVNRRVLSGEITTTAGMQELAQLANDTESFGLLDPSTMQGTASQYDEMWTNLSNGSALDKKDYDRYRSMAATNTGMANNVYYQHLEQGGGKQLPKDPQKIQEYLGENGPFIKWGKDSNTVATAANMLAQGFKVPAEGGEPETTVEITPPLIELAVAYMGDRGWVRDDPNNLKQAMAQVVADLDLVNQSKAFKEFRNLDKKLTERFISGARGDIRTGASDLIKQIEAANSSDSRSSGETGSPGQDTSGEQPPPADAPKATGTEFSQLDLSKVREENLPEVSGIGLGERGKINKEVRKDFIAANNRAPSKLESEVWLRTYPERYNVTIQDPAVRVAELERRLKDLSGSNFRYDGRKDRLKEELEKARKQAATAKQLLTK